MTIIRQGASVGALCLSALHKTHRDITSSRPCPRTSMRKAVIPLCGFLLLVVSDCGGGDSGGSGSGSGSTPPPLTVTEETLYAFGSSSTDAISPSGVLLKGSDGNFYGTTEYGGINGSVSSDNFTGNGTVFKITPTGEETVLYSFAGGSADGANPQVLIQGSDGNFYGVTSNGGANEVGTVFKLTPEGVETILYSFVAGNGPENPTGLIQASDGNFYGTSPLSGAYGSGQVFKVTPKGVLTLLYTFGATAFDGQDPVGQLVEASDGNFYGVTANGGQNCIPNGQVSLPCGTVFKITPSGVETIFHWFSGPDGTNPGAGLIQGSDGNFYGTTTGFFGRAGTVFEITPEGVETTLYTFSGFSGVPSPGLTEGSDGNFYGTTSLLGQTGGGLVFQLTPAGVVTVLYSFPSSKANPATNLVQGSDGNLYGTTQLGGAHGDGYFFRLVLH
jgi:uncharacterized repeat protein (TIGR03803 family)